MLVKQPTFDGIKEQVGECVGSTDWLEPTLTFPEDRGAIMPLAYVTEPGSVVRKQGETIVVSKDGQELAQWPLIHIEALVVCGGAQLTTPAMSALLFHGIDVSLVTQAGRLVGQIHPPKRGSVGLRLAQYAISQSGIERLPFARDIVTQKIRAMQDVLNRYAENYPELPLKPIRNRLDELAERVSTTTEIAELLGVEGAAAAEYWNAFPLLNRSSMEFNGRTRRPPKDPINALLSLGYAFLTNELTTIIETWGLDPFLGVYHTAANNRPSLALDLMEPFRHHIVDRLVLRAINLGRLRQEDFTESEDLGFRLSPNAFKTFICEYERMLQSSRTDPSDGTEGTWRQHLRRSVERWRQILQTLLSPEQLAAEVGEITDEDFDPELPLSSPSRSVVPVQSPSMAAGAAL